MGAQVTQALANLETALGAAGYGLTDVVRLTHYTTDVDRFVAEAPAGIGRLLASRRAAARRPRRSASRGSSLPAILVETEATAMR